MSDFHKKNSMANLYLLILINRLPTLIRHPFSNVRFEIPYTLRSKVRTRNFSCLRFGLLCLESAMPVRPRSPRPRLHPWLPPPPLPLSPRPRLLPPPILLHGQHPSSASKRSKRKRNRTRKPKVSPASPNLSASPPRGRRRPRRHRCGLAVRFHLRPTASTSALEAARQCVAQPGVTPSHATQRAALASSTMGEPLDVLLIGCRASAWRSMPLPVCSKWASWSVSTSPPAPSSHAPSLPSTPKTRTRPACRVFDEMSHPYASSFPMRIRLLLSSRLIFVRLMLASARQTVLCSQ
jgi:hypothetical protein